MKIVPLMFSRFLSTRIHLLLPKDSNATRIRIWKSGYFDADGQFVYTTVVTSLISSLKPGRQPNIGHVSIETRDLYASLWPEGINLFNKLKPQIGDAQTSSPSHDEKAEGRPPDVLVDLHTLNVPQIQQALVQCVDSGSTYHLIGSNRFFKSLSANSCSGLAFDLLHKGGIQKLVTKSHFLRDYIITTPNNLVTLVLEAHAKEKEILESRPTPPSSTYP